MYDDILLPIDGSDAATAATRHALDLGATYGATVHALYVVDTDTNWLTVSKSKVRDTLREVGEETGSQVLAEFETLAEESDADWTTELREGTPDDEILGAAADRGVDLVVMGTHGREGVRRRVVGSVAERVVRESSVPVLTVAGGDIAE